MKGLTGMTNGQIGELFGSMSYSAVAKAHKRFSTELGSNKPLRKRIETIKTDLSNVKFCPRAPTAICLAVTENSSTKAQVSVSFQHGSSGSGTSPVEWDTLRIEMLFDQPNPSGKPGGDFREVQKCSKEKEFLGIWRLSRLH